MPYDPKEPIIFPHITKYQILSQSLLNKPDTMSYQNHLSDTDITPPSSPRSITNNTSPHNYEDMSHPTSNYNVPQDIDDSHHGNFFYDDMRQNPLSFSSSQFIQSQPTTPLQIFPRVADSSHTFFPQFPRRNSTPLTHRCNSTPYNLRHLPHTNYH